jgi:hypothetical protein
MAENNRFKIPACVVFIDDLTIQFNGLRVFSYEPQKKQAHNPSMLKIV